MIRHDLSHWPLVLTIARGAPTLGDQTLFLTEWSHWLDRNERFATVRLFLDADALAHPEGGAREAKTWLRENAVRIRHLVLGMATIVPAAEFERMSRMDAEKLFGTPAQIFREIDGALVWLDEVLRPNEIAIDLAAVRASLVASAETTTLSHEAIDD
jgi:hypothetical protein